MAPAAVASARSAHPHEAAPRWISPPIEAPHHFDLVGVAREMRTVQIRVRDNGGRWTNWVDQDDGTPIYVGGADIAQVRAPFRPRGWLHFVNVSGTAGSFADRLVNSARHAINTAIISVASTPVAEAVSAEAADRQPRQPGVPISPRRLPAARAAPVRHGPGGRHPPHGQRQRLHPRGGALDRPRHLPLPRLRQRLERHRLQRPRRPLRDALRGPCRRPQAAGGRRPGSGLQLPDDLDRLDRRPHQRGAHATGPALDHPVPRLEVGGDHATRPPAPCS